MISRNGVEVWRQKLFTMLASIRRANLATRVTRIRNPYLDNYLQVTIISPISFEFSSIHRVFCSTKIVWRSFTVNVCYERLKAKKLGSCVIQEEVNIFLCRSCSVLIENRARGAENLLSTSKWIVNFLKPLISYHCYFGALRLGLSPHKSTFLL